MYPPVRSLIEETLTLHNAGEMAAAFQRAQLALQQAQNEGGAEAIAEALNNLALLHFRLGHYDQAHALARQSLALLPADSAWRAGALLVLGNCAAETCSFDDAETYYHQVIDLTRQSGHHRLRATALHNLSAGVYLPRGRFDLSLAADEQAYQVIVAQNFADLLYLPLVTLAWVYQLTGQPRRARARLDELSRIALPGSLAQGYHHFLSASLLLGEGGIARAIDLFGQARAIAEAIGDPGLNIEARLGLSRCHRLAGRAVAARDWAEDALTFAQRVGYRHLQGKSFIERGRALGELGDSVSATADFHAAIEILLPLGATFDLARARLLLAALLAASPPLPLSPAPQLLSSPSLFLAAAKDILAGGYGFLLDEERLLAYPLIAAHLNAPDKALAEASVALLEQLRRVPPPPFTVWMLGDFRVQMGARSIEKRALRQRGAGELLALLLISPGHTLTYEQIAEALCPEKDPAAAQTFVHHAVSALRRTLEPDLPDRRFPSRYLEVEEGRLTLTLPPESWLDFRAFESRCRAAQWEQALSLYAGDFLPEYRYTDWAIRQRETLAGQYQQALLAIAAEKLAHGDPQAALEHARRLLAIDPWQERAALLAMQACVQLKDLPAALRLYRNLEKTLRAELGIAPQEELQDLYRKIIA